MQRPKSHRLVARISVLLRREGGSLSITIPRHIVRHWKLEAGARLVLRSTDEGILLYPRYFAPYSVKTPVERDTQSSNARHPLDPPAHPPRQNSPRPSRQPPLPAPP